MDGRQLGAQAPSPAVRRLKTDYSSVSIMPQFDQRRSHLVILSAGGTTKGSDAESKDPDNASPAILPQGVLPYTRFLVFNFGTLGNSGDFGNRLCSSASSFPLCFKDFVVRFVLFSAPPRLRGKLLLSDHRITRSSPCLRASVVGFLGFPLCPLFLCVSKVLLLVICIHPRWVWLIANC
jgi:hypothetical protein